MAIDLMGVESGALRRELDRRSRAADAGKCDACGAWHDEPTCGNPRHGDAASMWYRRWKLEHGSSYLQAFRNGERRVSLTISRYGVSVRLYAPPQAFVATTRDGEPEAEFRGASSVGSAETNFPVDYTNDYPRSNLDDIGRFRWAVDWAITQLETT
jgi:hypothetical protein